MENGSYDAILGAHNPSLPHTTRPGPSDHPDRPTMTAHSDASQKGPKGAFEASSPSTAGSMRMVAPKGRVLHRKPRATVEAVDDR